MKRSVLFVPGNSAGMLLNADVLGGDGVIFDLEDAVSTSEKDAARILVRNAVKSLGYERSEVMIRVNALDSPYWESDIDEMVPLKPCALVLPKVRTKADMEKFDAYISRVEAAHGMAEGAVKLIPIIETALGVENAFVIASSSPRVEALLLGAEDLSAELRCKRTLGGEEIAYSRGRIVCAARAAGVDCYDTPFTDVNDDEGALADIKHARALGFSGKAAIAPRHVPFINEAFSPDADEIAYAIEVTAAIREAEERGMGVVSLQGKMIDAPIAIRAKQVLDMAKALGVDADA